MNPIVAVFLGWALAGEELTVRSLAASMVVLASVVMIVTSRKQPALQAVERETDYAYASRAS